MQLIKKMQQMQEQVAQSVMQQAELRTAVRDCRESMENIELGLKVAGAGQGKNAEDRKDNLRVSLNNDAQYKRYQESLSDLLAELDTVNAQVEICKRQTSLLVAEATFQAATIQANSVQL